MREKGYVYILFSRRNGTLYVGVTSDLVKRIYEHKNGLIRGFTSRYKVSHLGYYEIFDTISAAISREKVLKKYLRKQKLALIEGVNPDWNDLYEEITR